MNDIIPILIAVIFLILVTVIIVFAMSRPKGSGSKRSRGRDIILRDANKRLAQNPRDYGALMAAGDIYYQEQTWDLAFQIYETLGKMSTSINSADEFTVYQRLGVSAVKIGRLEEAARALNTAFVINPNDFNVCYHLGSLEFQLKNYEKAIQHFQKARTRDPEHAPTLRGLGHSLFKIKKYREALLFIRKAIDLAPEDKESLYTLAECYYEANQTEHALKIFGHLRADPVMGPNACLFSGTININQHQTLKAIEDFEIGLRHENIKPEVLIELKYRLANAYLRQNEIGQAIVLLKEVRNMNPNFKDVNNLIGRYQELNANKNLQVYLMAPQADFIALCRKIVMHYYNKAKVKVINVSVNKNEWADIQAEINTPKWSDMVMFRFNRSQGAVGELIVRDFHSHIKEVKAGKGICIAPGGFTEEAKRYTEARLIDLIAQDKLTPILNNVDAKTSRTALPR